MSRKNVAGLSWLDISASTAVGRPIAFVGFKEKYWKGVCADALKPAENWLYVDTTWQSKKWYRFDVYSNYFASGSLVRT